MGFGLRVGRSTAARFRVLRSVLTIPPVCGEITDSHGRTRTNTDGQTDHAEKCGDTILIS